MTEDTPNTPATMNVGLELVPGMRQEQILAPQLRECLRVLQMDWPTLVNEVRHEAEVNPVVEVESPEDMPPVSAEIRAETRKEEPLPDAPVEDDSNPSVNVDEEAAERRQRFFDRQVASESLQEHLLAQIGSSEIAEADRELAELIVGDVNDDGRYVGSLDELKDIVGAPAERIEAVLAKVQSFDPPGVGGRNLRECLAIQARQLEIEPEIRTAMLAIIDRGLSALARGDVAELAAACEAPERICRAAAEAIRSLEPKPGRPFIAHGKQPQFIRPELEIKVSRSGMELVSCGHELPTLTINPMYRDMAASSETPRETRRYLKERIGSAELLKDAIRRRGETIMRVTESVFAEQYDFFEKGFEALRPLTIEEVARRTGYHGTTVARAVHGKYVRTPRGVYELGRFFCVGRLSAGDAGLVSATSVKCRLSSIVRAEEDEVVTDEKMAEMLSRDGVKISRRTVAKYRSQLGIPPAPERMKRRKLA